MEEQHNENQKPNNIIESKEGQRVSLCCNKGFGRCPSLEYIYIESDDNLKRAYKTLFDEIFKDDCL
jgi:hypothetical protein